MKLHFTKKEYQSLLELAYMANWLLHAHAEEEEAETADYRQLLQKLLEAAPQFGLEEAVEREDKSGAYRLARRWGDEGRPMKFIERFENHTFWAELVHRLGRRDFLRLYGEERAKEMPLLERFEKETALQAQYDTEFADHGLDRLELAAHGAGKN